VSSFWEGENQGEAGRGLPWRQRVIVAESKSDWAVRLGDLEGFLLLQDFNFFRIK
jgi:hypothetical protein